MPRIEGTKVTEDLWVPLLTVRVELRHLAGGSASADFTALVDSGADMSLLPAELIEACGVGWDQLDVVKTPSRGVGGSLETRACNGSLSYKRWAFADGPLMVAEPGRVQMPLLGRGDFFAAFNVRFAWHRSPPTFDVDPAS